MIGNLADFPDVLPDPTCGKTSMKRPHTDLRTLVHGWSSQLAPSLSASSEGCPQGSLGPLLEHL